jgi:ABC-2 type transport system permease protein
MVERGRTRAFLLSTVFALVAIVAIVVVPPMFSDDTRTYRVGLAGVVASGLPDALTAQAKAADVQVSTTTYDTVAAGEQAVRDKAVDVLLVDGTTAEWRREPDAALGALVANAVQVTRVRERAAELGLSMQDVAGLLAPAALSNRQLSDNAGQPQNGPEVGLIAVVLILMAVSLYGNAVLTGVVQEKQTRVAEVLLARMSPRELLAGKVIGIGALGLAQFMLIIAAGVVALTQTRATEAPHVAASLWAWLLVWFVLGYAFYSVVYAAFGSLVSRLEDASSATAPISIVLFAGYFAAVIGIDSPDSIAARVLSFVPASAPFVMPVRLTLTTVPVWEVVTAALATAGAVWLLVAVAGRIYAGALLRSGTRVPLRLAWRGGGNR